MKLNNYTLIKTRRNFIKSSLASLFLVLPNKLLADECTANNIKEWRDTCFRALNDYYGMLVKAKEQEHKAFNKAEEAIKPGYDFLKGSFDILKAATSYCNPNTPGTDIKKCADTLISVPDTVKSGIETVKIIDEAIRIYKIADVLRGYGKSGFAEIGGDDAVVELENCGHLHCKIQLKALNAESDKMKQRISKNISNLNDLKSTVQNRTDTLQQCKNNPANCNEVPIINPPSLERPESDVPVPKPLG